MACAYTPQSVGAFRTRRLDHVTFPYIYLDATYLHVRTEHGMVVSKAVVIATGLRLVVRLHVDLMRTCGMRCLTV